MKYDMNSHYTSSATSTLAMSETTKKQLAEMSTLKHHFSRIRNNPKLILGCLCAAGVVQGMIFTNVVISTIERRFGLDSTQSGFVAGSYDLGSLLAIVPITYFGGRPSASKPRYISAGMIMIALGSFTFMLPHFTTERYDSSYFQFYPVFWVSSSNLVSYLYANKFFKLQLFRVDGNHDGFRRT